MIIIQKKRIQIILACIIMAIFTFTFQIGGNQGKKEENQGELDQQQGIIATTATPVSGKTIVVDAGHGVPDEGAESSNRYHRSGN